MDWEAHRARQFEREKRSSMEILSHPLHKEALAAWLLALADDELILGHRDSEWCGHAPILEEDIAFANLALDEIGHALLWYQILAGLVGEDPQSYPDRLVYRRPYTEFRCQQLVELPRGDWAFSMLRQYLFDAAELLRLEALSGSQYRPLAEAAMKVRKEELYHIRHSQAWVLRLGLGTQESHQRSQKALQELWPYTTQLFSHAQDEHGLVQAGILPEPRELYERWLARVGQHLDKSGLSTPGRAESSLTREEHTSHLKVLVAELQSVTRMDPQAAW